MEFKRLTSSNHDLYKEAIALYKDSFPYHEQRKPKSQIEIMRNNSYYFYLIFYEQIWVGNLLCWQTDDFIYVEHFCILPTMRNQKYGERALSLLATFGKPVILEIDPPIDDISCHRQNFYERAGFQANPFVHIHPPYHEECAGHALVVMSYPSVLSQEQYDKFNNYLIDVVMGQ